MTERIARTDPISGGVDIIPFDLAISDLIIAGLYSEVAQRLREGESIRLPSGYSYCALSALAEEAMDRLPANAAN